MGRKLIVFVLLLLVFSFASCAGGTGAEKNENDGKKVVTIDPLKDIASYNIVRGENCSDEEKAMVVAFHKSLNEALGTSLKISTDYTSSSKEILIGHTKRAESKRANEGLKLSDYVIKKEGNKLIIAGGSDAALQKALELYLENFVDRENKIAKYPADDGYLFEAKYVAEKLSINGIDISEFKIYNNSFMDIAELTERFTNAFGVSITSEKKLNEDGHYIKIDGTSLSVMDYGVSIEDGDIIISGSYHSLPYAVDHFLGDFFKEKDKKCDLSEKDSVSLDLGELEFYSKEQLYAVLEDAYNDPNKLIIGEQVQWSTDNCVEQMLGRFTNATGEYPAMMGIDLAEYGIDIMNKNDKQWSRFISDILLYCAEGGILTVSAHYDNPSGNTMGADRCRGLLGYDDTKEGYEKAFTDVITEGTELNTVFKKELDAGARFLKALTDQGLPVIFRPLHEANGNWFWFCTSQGNYTLDSSYIINLWKYIHDYYTNDLGLDNILWNYSPNYSGNYDNSLGTTMGTTYLYPGENYCDIVGMDWYTSGNHELEKGDGYLRLLDEASKIAGLNEFGPSGVLFAENEEIQPSLYDSMDMYSDIVELIDKGYSFGWLHTWGAHWGIVAMGRGDEFMQTELALGRADVKAMFEAIK